MVVIRYRTCCQYLLQAKYAADNRLSAAQADNQLHAPVHHFTIYNQIIQCTFYFEILHPTHFSMSLGSPGLSPDSSFDTTFDTSFGSDISASTPIQGVRITDRVRKRLLTSKAEDPNASLTKVGLQKVCTLRKLAHAIYRDFFHR